VLTIGGVSDVFTSTTMAVQVGDTNAPTIFTTSPVVGTTSATLVWFTTERADAQVAYGTTTSYGSLTTLDATLAFLHTVVLTGLAPSTTYHFQLRSKDASGNLATSADATFTTGAVADTVAPTISSVTASAIGSTTATVSWTTNEPATSAVYFAPGTSLDIASSPVVSDGAFVTNHSVVLSGLTASNTYTFAVRSKDASGNVTTSANATFSTATAPDTSAPVIASVTASAISSTTATVSWATNEPATTVVYFAPGITLDFATVPTVSNSALVTNHSIVLPGLTASTTYSFAVRSADASGNASTSTTSSFVTGL
jgi:hypothetical protein